MAARQSRLAGSTSTNCACLVDWSPYNHCCTHTQQRRIGHTPSSRRGRLRHLSCRILWLQSLISAGTIRLCSVSGNINPADIGTKRLSAPRLKSPMAVLGLYNETPEHLKAVMILGRSSSSGTMCALFFAPGSTEFPGL